MNVKRFDFAQMQTAITDEGFLIDSPIVARVGVQEYARDDGSIQYELRLPEDVFHPDSLQSMRGKPITVDHPPMRIVTAETANKVTVGTVLDKGRPEGDKVRTDIVIHSPDAIGDRRELSFGYTCDLEFTEGLYNNQKYDAIQRNIRINHLSVVKRGRAGVARLNVDSNEVNIINPMEQLMTVKVKLDNGLEYDAAPEVAAELTKLRADASVTAKALEAIPKLEAECDTLKAKVDGFADELKKANEAGRQDAANRLALEANADKLKIDHKDKTDREIKEAVILSVRKDADLKDKSDVYIDAAFDMALEVSKDDAMVEQRKAVNDRTDNPKPTSSKQTHSDYLKSLDARNKESK